VMFDLHDAIAPLPGSTAARNLLIERALEYLEPLARDARNDPRLAWEVALAYERIGLVQGYSAESNLGNGPAALESFKKSAAILDKLSASGAEKVRLQRDYVRVLNHLSSGYEHVGDFQSEENAARKCVTVAEEIWKANPGNPAAIAELAASLAAVADTLTNRQKYAEAIPIRERVLALTREYTQANKGSREGQRNLALAYKRLAAIYGVTERYDEARRNYEQARAIDEARWSANPADRAVAMDLSFDYSDLGWVLGRLKNEPAALASHLKALDLRKAAAAADPNDVRAATAVASSTERIANVYERLGDLDRALEWSRKALGLWSQMRELRTGDWTTVTGLARAHEDLADIYDEIAQKRREPAKWPIAAAEYEQARALYVGLQARGVLPPSESRKIEEMSKAIARVRQNIR